jgi:hypothetical protein
MVRNARAALNFLAPDEMDLSYSGSRMRSFMVQNLDLGYKDILNYIGSRDSLLPISQIFRLVTNIGELRAEQLNASSTVGLITYIKIRTMCCCYNSSRIKKVLDKNNILRRVNVNTIRNIY